MDRERRGTRAGATRIEADPWIEDDPWIEAGASENDGGAGGKATAPLGFLQAVVRCLAALMAAAAFLTLVGGFTLAYMFEFARTTIAEFENEATEYGVTFQEVGSAFLFGPSDVRVVLEDEAGRNVAVVEDAIMNDGGALDAGNITVEWTDAGALVTLHGSEQEDAQHMMRY